MSNARTTIDRLRRGQRLDTDQLFAEVYSELRSLASRKLASERLDHTLSATALVNEAYLRLIGEDDKSIGWDSKTHFFLAASEAMRRILIDSYRRKRAEKRGGNAAKYPLIEVDVPWSDHHEEMLAIEEYLDEFARRHPRQAEVFKLRCYGGLSSSQVAQALNVSKRTSEIDWAFARAWLSEKIGE
ncbi:ECF-type sigma factor [Thalassoglobus sp. JC818]|uniref:ECF-type sigma factor n=1 Tax=Thalassoglobus sp. JC818 TaxID=3232136 RepID=UPI00345A23CC